ncbi:SDR family oxidoreductase [Chitinophaga rhizophila]|uniref:SDR family oxidoreductase n=1 Tax=Chitinophaga rhizophila TaxID=2866212 RepID=A0ABS7GD38_9BACT|nr:SDR family oxidoreductase [Chitinophaga rhizophila]MBW8685582.1 SDR family oxidoreductase [Chitinophaga rhizophila]
MENQIADKVVVITGASSGAGRATAFELAEGKASLVLASRNEAVLEELAEECRKIGSEVLVVPTDVTDNTAMHRLAVKAFEWKGRIDVWVNNAGVLAAGTFDEMPWEAHQKVIDTNLLGYMSGAHAVLPHFKRQGAGILINNISIGGYVAVPFGGAYTASKFALRGFFESLKGELTEWPDIHIVDLFPAFLDTPGIQHAGNYTGKVLKPSPPVYDPRIVARSVRASIIHPKSTRYPGGAPWLFKLGHALAPEWMSKITGMLMKGYFKIADPTEVTDGNLFNSVNFSMSTNGNSRPRLSPQTKRMISAGLLLGGAFGLATYLLSKRTGTV